MIIYYWDDRDGTEFQAPSPGRSLGEAKAEGQVFFKEENNWTFNKRNYQQKTKTPSAPKRSKGCCLEFLFCKTEPKNIFWGVLVGVQIMFFEVYTSKARLPTQAFVILGV